MAAKKISELVRIKRRDDPIEPLLSPSEEMFVRHNLRVMMEQAQLSLLREEQQVFDASIHKSHRWVTQYFEFNDNSGVLVDQLERLSTVQVVQDLPDISSSLEALREYIDSWHKRQEVSQLQSGTAPDQAQAPAESE